MHSTSRDYAPKQYLDPVSEVEREALDKGFNRGVLFTVASLIATFVVMEGITALGRWLLQVLS